MISRIKYPYIHTRIKRVSFIKMSKKVATASIWGFPGSSDIKNAPAMQETWV